jgi:hypothetical protein
MARRTGFGGRFTPGKHHDYYVSENAKSHYARGGAAQRSLPGGAAQYSHGGSADEEADIANLNELQMAKEQAHQAPDDMDASAPNSQEAQEINEMARYRTGQGARELQYHWGQGAKTAQHQQSPTIEELWEEAQKDYPYHEGDTLDDND